MKAMALLVGFVALGACKNDNPSAPQDGSVITDGASGPPDASCFDITGMTNPTHYQIINACTTADKVFKDSHPPLVNADGSLPPLPSAGPTQIVPPP